MLHRSLGDAAAASTAPNPDSELEKELEGMAEHRGHPGLGSGTGGDEEEYVRGIASTELEYASEELDAS